MPVVSPIAPSACGPIEIETLPRSPGGEKRRLVDLDSWLSALPHACSASQNTSRCFQLQFMANEEGNGRVRGGGKSVGGAYPRGRLWLRTGTEEACFCASSRS